MKAIWSCTICIEDYDGKLPVGSDFPMRKAVKEAFFKLTGQEEDYIASGWVDKLLTNTSKENNGE